MNTVNNSARLMQMIHFLQLRKTFKTNISIKNVKIYIKFQLKKNEIYMNTINNYATLM